MQLEADCAEFEHVIRQKDEEISLAQDSVEKHVKINSTLTKQVEQLE